MLISYFYSLYCIHIYRGNTVKWRFFCYILGHDNELKGGLISLNVAAASLERLLE